MAVRDKFTKKMEHDVATAYWKKGITFEETKKVYPMITRHAWTQIINERKPKNLQKRNYEIPRLKTESRVKGKDESYYTEDEMFEQAKNRTIPKETLQIFEMGRAYGNTLTHGGYERK